MNMELHYLRQSLSQYKTITLAVLISGFFQKKNIPDKISDQFSIWSEKLDFDWKAADCRPLFQALS